MRRWISRELGIAPSALLDGTASTIDTKSVYPNHGMPSTAAAMLGLPLSGRAVQQQVELLAGSAFAVAHFALSIFADMTLRDSLDDVQMLASARYKLKGA